MANQQSINFATAFLSDGVSGTAVLDLSEATSFSPPAGNSITTDVRLASGSAFHERCQHSRLDACSHRLTSVLSAADVVSYAQF